jgi:bifunctional non-homologous end joining protein LigD
MIAIFDQKLVSRFEWLRRRTPAEIATPPLFMVFDCPYARGKDLRDRPLYVRRNVIEDTLDGQDLVLPIRRLSDDGLKAWQQVLERGYEGLVAKDPASPYVGGRTLRWLKAKQARYREGERGWEPKGRLQATLRCAGVDSTRWPSRPVPPRRRGQVGGP